MTAAATGEESVTVPAGTFMCWKLEVTGGSQPQNFWVMKDAPNVVVKYEIVGSPVSVELTARQ